MSWFNWFKKKKPEPEVILETQPEVTTEAIDIKTEPEGRIFINEPCAICKQVIGTDKWRKKGHTFMHKKCLKEEINSAKQKMGLS